MHNIKYFLERHHRIIIALVFAYTLTVSVLNAFNDSLIYDEDAHIPAGYSYLKTHDLRLNPEHPPLLKDMAALPLLLLNPTFDTQQSFWNENPNDAQWNAGKYFLYGAGNNPDAIIFLSRLPFILLYFILGLFIFKWARELAGVVGGLLAFLLFALDPNILGHNHFVTTDLGIAAFLTFSFYYFLQFIKNPTWKNTWLFGIFWGMVQLVKFSSVLAFPVFGLILLLYPLTKRNAAGITPSWKDKFTLLAQYIGKGLLAFIISLVLVWAVYFINVYQMPPEKLPEITNYYFHTGDSNPKEVYTKKFLFSLNEVPALRPLADYFFGVARVFQRVAGGNVTYFFGQLDTKGFLAYFPLVFLIKTPLPTLFLILTATLIGIWRFGCWTRNLTRKSEPSLGQAIAQHITGFTLLTFVALYVLSSIIGKLNIGLRHLFPIFPFLYILVGASIARLIKQTHDQKIRFSYYGIIFFLLTFLAIEVITSYPNYLSYFNQSVGGPTQGYRYVTDSNADWGQDLKRLELFLNRHPEINKIRLNYFGLADPNYYLGSRYEPWWDARRPIEAGWYAISTNFLMESLHDQSRLAGSSYAWIKDITPNYQVGTSLLIYYIAPEVLQRLTY